jgi:hypothetical protein
MRSLRRGGDEAVARGGGVAARRDGVAGVLFSHSVRLGLDSFIFVLARLIGASRRPDFLLRCVDLVSLSPHRPESRFD